MAHDVSQFFRELLAVHGIDHEYVLILFRERVVSFLLDTSSDDDGLSNGHGLARYLRPVRSFGQVRLLIAFRADDAGRSLHDARDLPWWLEGKEHALLAHSQDLRL